MCTLWKIWNSRIEKIFEGGANSLTIMNSHNEKIFQGGGNSQLKLTEAIKDTSIWRGIIEDGRCIVLRLQPMVQPWQLNSLV
ncbi:hypothetical protein HanHA300_Chr10g0367711 [Helianthus annuus]|nr:hypothetical protein HanHA300_Chr10g0367711 [Helianthus annuus]KAJ0530410.1 hypothetical protein HanHA89_Chr10g0389581 [Helianthus annuus]